MVMIIVTYASCESYHMLRSLKESPSPPSKKINNSFYTSSEQILKGALRRIRREELRFGANEKREFGAKQTITMHGLTNKSFEAEKRSKTIGVLLSSWTKGALKYVLSKSRYLFYILGALNIYL